MAMNIFISDEHICGIALGSLLYFSLYINEISLCHQVLATSGSKIAYWNGQDNLHLI